MAEDNIQHGIDDNPHNDAEKGAALGGLGGAAVGAMAGAAVGPVGAIVGAVVGGLAGAGASGAAVAAVDEADNDNTVTGLGNGATHDIASPTTDDVAAANHSADSSVHSTIGSADIVGHATHHTHANATETGTASANAVFPSPSTGHEGISQADVSDMNIDSQNMEDRDVVPNVRYDDNPAASDNTNMGTAGLGDDVGNTSDVAVGRTPSTGVGTDTSGLGTGIGNDLPGVQVGGSNPVPDNRGVSDQNSDISSGNIGNNSGGQTRGQF